jgi:hypothetical protein
MVVVGVDEGHRDARVRGEVTGLGAAECRVDHEVVTIEFDPHRRDVRATVGVEARHVREDLLGDKFASGGSERFGHRHPDVSGQRER